jgi:limonene 1,2-monooxygenase
MIGLDQSETRLLLEQGTDVIVQLLRTDDPVTFKNERWDLREARLHLRPYSDFEVAIAAVASPSGPRLAGKYGLGLLSVGATQAAGFDVLGLHWDVMEERAATFGTTVDRSKWRLVGLCHAARTQKQAFKEVEYGMAQWFDYFQHTAAFPQMDVGQGVKVKEMIDFVRDGGIGAIGTPDEVGAQIESLWKQSNGGFGAYLMLAHEWADPEATKRSYELIARHVMPEFQGQGSSTLEAKARARVARPELAQQSITAVEMMTKKYQEELAAKIG